MNSSSRCRGSRLRRISFCFNPISSHRPSMTALALIAIDSNARTLTALVLEQSKPLSREARVAGRAGDHVGSAGCTCRAQVHTSRASCTRCTCSTRRTGCACRGWAWRLALRRDALRRLRSRSRSRMAAPLHRCIAASPHRRTLQTFGRARSGHLCREKVAMDAELDSAQFLSLEVRVRSNRQLRVSAASQRIAQERAPSRCITSP